MKRTSAKKEQRKHRRSDPKGDHAKKARERASVPQMKVVPNRSQEEVCENCAKDLTGNERALFVEEELGRIFCSERCIAAHFTPEIERLEKEYFKRLSANDLEASQREALAHLRWITLQDPDEVWREKTLTGDYRYTLISEFQPENKKIWSICICLFLRGEPSFLYLAFPTKSLAMVNHYRRGERVQWVRPDKSAQSTESESSPAPEESPSDRLADSWTEEETFLAESNMQRRDDDIPQDEYSLYHSCLEETLEAPDEVWTLHSAEEKGSTATDPSEPSDPDESLTTYHFIKHYPDEKPGVWYIVVARDSEAAGEGSAGEEQIEIMEAFPTNDRALVDRYRRGAQEVGGIQSSPATRVVH